jgi:hypothetical protein
MVINDKEIDDKIKEIRKLLNRGVPEGEIREQLLKDGYTKAEIDGYFFKPHYYDMRTWYMVFAILLLLVGAWLFITDGYWIILVMSGLLFHQHYREVQRLKRLKKPD